MRDRKKKKERDEINKENKNGDANSLRGGNATFFPVNKVRCVENPPMRLDIVCFDLLRTNNG